MQYLAGKLTDYLIKKRKISTEQYAIYQYGFTCFLEIFMNILCSAAIAFLLDMPLECLLFFVFFIPVRSLNGGFHMKTYVQCLIVSCFSLTALLLFVKYITPPTVFSFLLYLVTLFLIKKTGPIDHPNRKVDAQENFIFTKKEEVFLSLSFLIAILFLIFHLEHFLFLEALVFVLILITAIIH